MARCAEQSVFLPFGISWNHDILQRSQTLDEVELLEDNSKGLLV